MTDEAAESTRAGAEGQPEPPATPIRGPGGKFAAGNKAAVTHGLHTEATLAEIARAELQRLTTDYPQLAERFPDELLAYATAWALFLGYVAHASRVGLLDDNGEARPWLHRELNRWYLRSAEGRTRLGLHPQSAARFPMSDEERVARQRAAIQRARERLPELMPPGWEDEDPWNCIPPS